MTFICPRVPAGRDTLETSGMTIRWEVHALVRLQESIFPAAVLKSQAPIY